LHAGDLVRIGEQELRLVSAGHDRIDPISSADVDPATPPR
jgi:hypothetical protein